MRIDEVVVAVMGVVLVGLAVTGSTIGYVAALVLPVLTRVFAGSEAFRRIWLSRTEPVDDLY